MRKIGKHLMVTEEDGRPRLLFSASGSLLGRFEWYPRWRQFVFHPYHGSIYSPDCLDDISAYLKAVKPGVRHA